MMLKKIEVRTPRIDFFESPEAYLFRVSIPGVSQNNIRIKVKRKNQLEVKGIVEPIIPKKFDKVITQEIFQGPFLKRLSLPQDIDLSSIDFDYYGGILYIYISKKG